MVKAIIFDLGGVYFSAGAEDALKNLVKEFPDIDPQKIKAIITTGDISKKYRYGKLTKTEFWKRAVQLAGTGFDVRKFSLIWNSSYQLNTEVAELVDQLKKRYKLAVSSGSTRERVKFLQQKYQFKSNFAVLVFSYQIGTNKPDPRMYQEVLKRLKVPAQECIFVDDKKEKLNSAEQLGMKVIHFQNSGQLREEMAALGVEFG